MSNYRATGVTQYKADELRLLDKNKLIDIILNQEERLLYSPKGQPKRDNLVGESFGALTVVGDAGNSQGHSVWHCRCSGNISDPSVTGVCDRTVTAWGSNLKADRQWYCGDDTCPAARQMLAKKRRGDLKLDSGLNRFIRESLTFKYTLLGDQAPEVILREYNYLTAVLQQYYGTGEGSVAFRIQEIAQRIGIRQLQVSAYKKSLDKYIADYQELVNESDQA